MGGSAGGQRQRRRRGRRSSALPIAVSVLVVLTVFVLAGLFLRFYVWDRLKTEVAGAATNIVMEKAVEQVLSSRGIDGDDGRVREILDSIDEEDRQTVTRIVTDHFDAETVSEVVSGIANGDAAEVFQYAEEELSAEEKQELLELAMKYPELAGQLFEGFAD